MKTPRTIVSNMFNANYNDGERSIHEAEKITREHLERLAGPDPAVCDDLLVILAGVVEDAENDQHANISHLSVKGYI